MMFSQAVKYPSFKPKPQKLKLKLFSRAALRPALIVLLTAAAQSSVFSFLVLFARERSISNPGLFFATSSELGAFQKASFEVAPLPIQERDIKSTFTVDVVVIGGGTSGMFAALNTWKQLTVRLSRKNCK